MSVTPHTIYDEMRKLAVKMGVSSDELAKTHNIKDLIRAINAHLELESNAQHISDGVKKYTDAYTAETSEPQRRLISYKFY